MIAIHDDNRNDFSRTWIQYCQKHRLKFKIVSCYDTDILDQLKDCRLLLWHVNNYDYRDQIFAKYLIKSLQNRNISTFPDYNTVWHFDDKVAQKYLLESINAPLVKSYVFYDRISAEHWLRRTEIPVVFKLRRGAGSKNVYLVRSIKEGGKRIRQAFGKGYKAINMRDVLKERIRKFRLGKETLKGVLKGVIRVFIKTPYVNLTIKEKGYVYFQRFLPKNNYDQRIIVIGNRAIGLKRMVRENDFRASGSGEFYYDKDLFDLECVRIAFEVSNKLQFQSMAYDFIYDEQGQPKIVEISFCFTKEVYYPCPGYWDPNLIWHEAKVVPEHWILKDALSAISKTLAYA